MSLDTARRALASCEEAGYLTVRANRMENGGQLENTYCVTKSGDGVIEAARRAGSSPRFLHLLCLSRRLLGLGGFGLRIRVSHAGL